MGIKTTVSEDGNMVTLKVSGRFDFSVHKDFRAAFEEAAKTANKPSYTIDLREVGYVDSSALGMLLLLRDRSGGEKSRIQIINCCPTIMDVLRIANFHRLFTVKPA